MTFGSFVLFLHVLPAWECGVGINLLQFKMSCEIGTQELTEPCISHVSTLHMFFPFLC